MIPKLYEILLADSAVVALIGNPLKLFPYGQAPNETEFPYVTYTVYNGRPENYLNQLPDVDNFGTQIDVWAEDNRSCLAVATAIRDALEPDNHMTSQSQLDRDEETTAYRIRMDFDMFTFR